MPDQPDRQEQNAERERQRIARRQLRSPRSFASIVAALVVAAICLYFMFEAAMKSIGQDIWIKSPGQWWDWFAGLPRGADPVLLPLASLLVLLLGLYFLLQGVLPGRKARRILPNDRAIVLVDHEVIAATLARRARTEANVSPEQVMVVVGHTMVDVNVRPTSGIRLRADAIQKAVEDELVRNLVDPLPKVSVRISESGVVGQ
ncbi:hypothetical protein [Zhihengliuella sp.]|uniref:hypothetical protein n=1 Tax=Zhihengliuella sp. TaxID=1954483 RepID=UPI0028122774|nr:hypothetical protein [Zhihengliuella sp.]